ncbi:hypothetical protein ABPG72_015951 [Tetrahymena utriculariae]
MKVHQGDGSQNIQPNKLNYKIRKKRKGLCQNFQKWNEWLVIEWISNQRINKLPLSMKSIQNKAKELIEPAYKKTFNASKGWFQKFQQRWKLSRRVSTYLQTQIKDDCIKELQKWHAGLRTQRIEEGINKQNQIIFINFDETAVFYNLSSIKTYETKGKKEIVIKTVSSGKQRIIVGLTVMSNQFKLPILCIFKSNQKIQSINNNKLVVAQNESGWITDSILIDYLEKIIFNLKIFENMSFYLIWDQCPIHKKESLIKQLKERNLPFSFIPPGCTSLFQPIDISINKPFKDKLRNQFDL